MGAWGGSREVHVILRLSSVPAPHVDSRPVREAFAPGWFLGEQGRDIRGQLELGTRALLFDVWYGFPAGSVVRTT